MNRLLPRLPLLLALTLAVAVRAADKLDGAWKPSAAELGGVPMPQAVLDTITLTIEGSHYVVVVQTGRGPSPDKGDLVLDAAVNPKAITIHGTAGPNAGRTIPAIYELGTDSLRICYDLSGKQRPTAFKTVPHSKLYLVTYRRAQ